MRNTHPKGDGYASAKTLRHEMPLRVAEASSSKARHKIPSSRSQQRLLPSQDVFPPFGLHDDDMTDCPTTDERNGTHTEPTAVSGRITYRRLLGDA